VATCSFYRGQLTRRVCVGGYFERIRRVSRGWQRPQQRPRKSQARAMPSLRCHGSLGRITSLGGFLFGCMESTVSPHVFFLGGGGRGASFGRSSAIGVESTKQVPVPVLRPGLRLVQVGVRPTEFCDPAPVSHRYFETLLHFISALGWVEWTRGGVPEHFHRHRDFRSAVFREFQIWDSRRRGEVSLESGALDPHAFRTATVSLFRGGFS